MVIENRVNFAEQKLPNRIDTFLNLNATSSVSSELYQVANYGLAGQYTAHYDQVNCAFSTFYHH